MILENCLVRTLDRQVPTQRALAIAGERIAGGVGVHETALASPETIDLGGRVVLPGFTDAHVHFPTWAVAQHEVRPAAREPGDLQPYGIGTDINRSKSRHGKQHSLHG